MASVGDIADIVTAHLGEVTTVVQRSAPVAGFTLSALSALHLRNPDRSKAGSVMGIATGLGIASLATLDPVEMTEWLQRLVTEALR